MYFANFEILNFYQNYSKVLNKISRPSDAHNMILGLA